jgi:Ca2+-binding RTX toxin-like protein
MAVRYDPRMRGCMRFRGLSPVVGLLAATSIVLLFAVNVASTEAAGPVGRGARGIYVAYCQESEPSKKPGSPHPTRPAPPAESPEPIEPLAAPTPQATPLSGAFEALADHTGWPSDECLKMDKGGPGPSYTFRGMAKVHNYLLGGYGNDTIFAGSKGDVIWGDYQPSGQSERESDHLHGGAGADWIYSSHGHNEIWTGAGNDHVALIYGSGIVFCNGAGLKTLVMRYLPQNRHWHLVGCAHSRIAPYKA